MSDTYQAVYDAVRSRIGHADIGAAVERAIHELNLSHWAEQVAHAQMNAAAAQTAPSVLYRPTQSIDGNKWCALYGDNLQDGVAGFGDTPAAAMADFDARWNEKLLISRLP